MHAVICSTQDTHHLGGSDGRGLGVLQALQGGGEVLVQDGHSTGAQILLLPATTAQNQPVNTHSFHTYCLIVSLLSHQLWISLLQADRPASTSRTLRSPNTKPWGGGREEEEEKSLMETFTVRDSCVFKCVPTRFLDKEKHMFMQGGVVLCSDLW